MAKVKLLSADKELFEVDEEVASYSHTVKNLLEDAGAGDAVPLPNVSGKILAKVIEFCKFHVEADKKAAADKKPVAEDAKDAKDAKDQTKTTPEVEAFNSGFITDKATHVELTLAANYLNINTLLDLCCKKWADEIKGKTPEEIRTMFNLKDDLTEEDKERIRAETVWKFE
ncbi:hypothetical protein HYH03_016955 [Edaphochlamys debaryana]|uniref:SKP1-like protein n=1 Tax=Edaphochlamys debaryana TaxID=47281 RepID=A0A835XNL8_9CHLO|nr:hypothetical protein HYH03_016955 [Edaphochlamys debaryana]|eukprot:KAG2484220.1 hypothetical protein HYH03_016955 [Edaphochlamys debaryana]